MFLGMLQFWFGRSIFGDIGLEPSKKVDLSDASESTEIVEEKQPSHIQRDRYVVVGILAFFTVFFWAAF